MKFKFYGINTVITSYESDVLYMFSMYNLSTNPEFPQRAQQNALSSKPTTSSTDQVCVLSLFGDAYWTWLGFDFDGIGIFERISWEDQARAGN